MNYRKKKLDKEFELKIELPSRREVKVYKGSQHVKIIIATWFFR